MYDIIPPRLSGGQAKTKKDRKKAPIREIEGVRVVEMKDVVFEGDKKITPHAAAVELSMRSNMARRSTAFLLSLLLIFTPVVSFDAYASEDDTQQAETNEQQESKDVNEDLAVEEEGEEDNKEDADSEGDDGEKNEDSSEEVDSEQEDDSKQENGDTKEEESQEDPSAEPQDDATTTDETSTSSPGHPEQGEGSQDEDASTGETSTSTPTTKEEPVEESKSSEGKSVADIDSEVLEKIRKEIKEELEEEYKNQVFSEYNFENTECEFLSEDEVHCLRSETLERNEGYADSFTGVFARKNESGRSDIFFQRGSRVTKVSNNDHENTSPFYDEHTDTIVWQARINDRTQIMLYERGTGRTVQLTDTPHNNTNPHIKNNIVTWQGWGENRWDVYVASKEENWNPKRITNNSRHDINPRVYGDTVLWESSENGSRHIFAYYIYSGEIEQISAGDGNNRNPRMLIVWDKREGDEVKTLQYDATTRQVGALTGRENKKEDHAPIPLPKKQQENSEAVFLTSTQNLKNDDEDSDEE